MNRNQLTLVYALALSFCLACQDSPKTAVTPSPVDTFMNNGEITSPLKDIMPLGFDELVAAYDNVQRADWQQPDKVISYLGDISNKVVADIGAGSGYFSYRLLQRGAKVVATDIDPRFIKWLNDHISDFDIDLQGNFETRLATPYNSKLGAEELDAAILINTISYITDRTGYLSDLRKSLKADGQILIVDYKTKRIPVASPELLDRSIVGYVEEDLLKSGYQNVRIDECSLDFQWIIMAEK